MLHQATFVTHSTNNNGWGDKKFTRDEILLAVITYRCETSYRSGVKLERASKRCQRYNTILLLAPIAATLRQDCVTSFWYVTLGNLSCNLSRIEIATQVSRNIAQFIADLNLSLYVLFYQVKAIYLHPDPFSVENGLLTPTLKFKRPDITNHFKDTFAEMYSKLQEQSDLSF